LLNLYFKEILDSIMDISSFNKELGIKIAQAKGLERNDDVKAAIKLWLEISEMAIRFSKSRNLDASFKNMIINRTQGIFTHIKNLKASQVKEESLIEEIKTQEVIPLVESPLEQGTYKPTHFSEPEVLEKNTTVSPPTTNEISDDSESKILPNGFKELKTSEEFRIITPHDENYVKKHLSEGNINISNLKKDVMSDEMLPPGEERFEFDESKDGNNLICFACGYENPLSLKICKNCGISLN